MRHDALRDPRPAEMRDAGAIADVIRLAFAAQSVVTDPLPSALNETEDTVADHLRRGGGAVLERDGQVVGAVLWNEDDGSLYVGRLSVDPAYRRRGIARRLMDEAEAEARRQGLMRMTLGARLALEDNRQLFRSCGFEEKSLHAHAGFSEPTWVLMERRLT